jgi:hypothetical protein
MSAEDVDRAVAAARYSSAEEDVPEVIARMLEVSRDLVVRVRAAFELAEDTRLALATSSLEELPEELRTAYAAEVRRGIMRMRVRRAIQHGEFVYAHVKKFAKQPDQVCRGCPVSIRCVAQNFTTPEVCYRDGPVVRVDDDASTPGRFRLTRLSHAAVRTRPLQIRGDRVTVDCAHPLGTYVLDIGDLLP